MFCDEFAHFMEENEIKHLRIAPCHPAINGLAEDFISWDGGEVSLKQYSENFLLTYRTTPHVTTKKALCKLMMGRAIRTRLDFLRPSIGNEVLEQ